MADLDPIDPVTFLSGSTHNALIFHRRKKEKKKKSADSAELLPSCRLGRISQGPAIIQNTIATEPPVISNMEPGIRRVQLFTPIARSTFLAMCGRE